jgi:hypothetical protein
MLFVDYTIIYLKFYFSHLTTVIRLLNQITIS